MTTKWIQDAGHGGPDPGAVANGIVEAHFTLEAAMHVQQRLKECGVISDVTRTGDSRLSVGERTGMIEEYTYCLSHHFNAGGGSGAEFIHSIYSDGAFEQLLLEQFIDAGYPVRPKPIYTKTLQSNQKKDYYYMHRDTGKCRTTIIEYEFVDGPNHSKLNDPLYRQGMYECVVRAICQQEGVKYVPLNSPKNKLYRVQVGAFSQKENAKRLQGQLITQGYEAIIVEV